MYYVCVGMYSIDLERTASLRGKLYRLPGGSVGREFTSILAEEYDFLASGKQKSERPSMFGKLILQKDKNIKKSTDIRRLIKRRLQMWKDDLLEELIQEAESCDKKLPTGGTKMSNDKAAAVFSKLVLQGKIREAVRFVTDRSETGGVLQPDDNAGKGKTVREVLESKHPEQKIPNSDAFVPCEDLPFLVDVDITAEHVKKIAGFLSGSAGVSGLDGAQWQDLLLKHSGASEKLRESMAALVRRLANSSC
jgi:hypothetical protein